MSRTVIRKNEVTTTEWGHLTEAEIDKAYELALANDRGRLPPTYFDSAEPHAAWRNEVERAVLDGEIALGLYHGPTTADGSPVAAPVFQVLIARRKGQAGGHYVILSEVHDPQDLEASAALLNAARAIAEANGAKLLRLHYVPAIYEWVEA